MEEFQDMSEEMTESDELFFDETDFPDADDGDHTASAEENTATEENGESPEQEQAAEQNEETVENAEPEPETDDWIELDYLDEKRRVGKEEAKRLSQMGLNHDRMKQQRDDMRNALQEQLNWRSQNQEHIDDIAKLAEASGMDVASFVNAMKENLYVRKGMSRDAAKERVEREKIQRQLDAKTNYETQKTQRENAQRDRVQREIADFSQRFPDVDVKTIPQEVFQEAAEGKVSLTGAYISHLNSQLKTENERLQAEVKAYKQNEKNKKAAVGSAKTQGSDAVYDDFLRGFDDE